MSKEPKTCKCASHSYAECFCGAWDDLNPHTLQRELAAVKAERDCLREQLTIAWAGLTWCESTHAIDWEYRMRAETALRDIKMAAIRRRMPCGLQK